MCGVITDLIYSNFMSVMWNVLAICGTIHVDKV